jgi:hypothetical protein
MRLYNRLKTEWLLDHNWCEVCRAAPAGHIHHKAGRLGRWLNDTSEWLAVCLACHDRIHANPAWARANGFSK